MLNGTVGSNPTLSAKKENKHYVWRSTQVAQEDPLLRDEAGLTGARGRIPPSPPIFLIKEFGPLAQLVRAPGS